MAPPRSLLSLNEDVLREILAHLLLDTPLESNRASILRACSLLHALGLPFLYQTVDLRGFGTSAIMLEHWRRLFGTGGVLTEGEAKKEARTVKELRLGGELSGYLPDIKAQAASLTIQKVSLPSCSRLVVDVYHSDGLLRYLPGPLLLLLQLPITQLRVESEQNPFNPSKRFRYFEFRSFTNLASLLFGSSSSRCPWNDLHTIVFDECLWSEHPGSYRWDDSYTLSCSHWSFKLLVFEVTPRNSSSNPMDARVFDEYLRPDARSCHRFLVDTERIELRTKGAGAGKFEDELRKKVGQRPLDASQRRIFELVVFVGEDGQERRLMEGLS